MFCVSTIMGRARRYMQEDRELMVGICIVLEAIEMLKLSEVAFLFGFV